MQEPHPHNRKRLTTPALPPENWQPPAEEVAKIRSRYPHHDASDDTIDYITTATEAYLEGAVAELFMRYSQRARDHNLSGFSFLAKCRGSSNGDVEMTFSVDLTSHYVSSSDPTAADIGSAFNEAERRYGFNNTNRTGRLLAGPRLEAREQIDAARAAAIAAE